MEAAIDTCTNAPVNGKPLLNVRQGKGRMPAIIYGSVECWNDATINQPMSGIDPVRPNELRGGAHVRRLQSAQRAKTLHVLPSTTNRRQFLPTANWSRF